MKYITTILLLILFLRDFTVLGIIPITSNVDD